MGVRDGLGFEEVTHDQNLVTTSQDAYFDNVSGTNFLAAGSFVGVGINITTISGTTIRVDSEGVLHSTSIGSGPSVFGAKIQAGSGALSAGSVDWIVFPTAYVGLPSVLVSNRDSLTDLRVVAGSINAGSAYIIGTTASDDYNWLSVGI